MAQSQVTNCLGRDCVPRPRLIAPAISPSTNTPAGSGNRVRLLLVPLAHERPARNRHRSHHPRSLRWRRSDPHRWHVQALGAGSPARLSGNRRAWLRGLPLLRQALCAGSGSRPPLIRPVTAIGADSRAASISLSTRSLRSGGIGLYQRHDLFCRSPLAALSPRPA